MSKNGSKRSFIDSVEVKSPCSEDWNDMKGTDKVRFCSHCAKNVNNLSEMTRKEATRLVRASGGSLCIRYRLDPGTRRPIFAEQLLQITRRTPGFAAGVMGASLAISAQTVAPPRSTGPQSPPIAIQQEQTPGIRADAVTKEETRSGRLAGSVADPAGAVIPGVSVELTSTRSGQKWLTSTDADGNYAFDSVQVGEYELLFHGVGGFAERRVSGVAVSDGRVTESRVELQPQVYVTMGVVAYSSREPATLLAKAVDDEDVELVRELIAKGEDVNGREEDKSTPLFAAVETGSIEIVEMLLDAGAKINARNEERQTPLMQLDYDATPELVDLLVRHGAKLNLTDKENNTALIIATDNGVNADVVEALIRAGADVKLANKAGTTALMNAANRDDLASVRLIVEAGADVNAKDDEGETAWDKTGDDEIEQYLVGHGAIVPVEEIDDEPTPIDNR